MDLIMLEKAFSLGKPLLKKVLEKDDIDLKEEIRRLHLVYPSLLYIIEELESFYNSFLSQNEFDMDQFDYEKFSEEYFRILALLQSSNFLFQQTSLGRFIFSSMDEVRNAMLSLHHAIVYELSGFRTKIRLRADGKLESYKDARKAILINLTILRSHQNHWNIIFKENGRNNKNTDKKHEKIELDRNS